MSSASRRDAGEYAYYYAIFLLRSQAEFFSADVPWAVLTSTLGSTDGPARRFVGKIEGIEMLKIGQDRLAA
jgi:hypothetical protein